jgi:hypothetical protein
MPTNKNDPPQNIDSRTSMPHSSGPIVKLRVPVTGDPPNTVPQGIGEVPYSDHLFVAQLRK